MLVLDLGAGAVSITPEQFYKAMADVLLDVCGGYSPVRIDPITQAEWYEIQARFEMIVLANREEENDERSSVRKTQRSRRSTTL